VTVGAEEPFSGAWLRLTATEPHTCRIAAHPTAVKTGTCTPAIPARSPAIAEGDSLAYFTYRRLTSNNTETRRSELGAVGHGTNGHDLAARLNDQVRAWGSHRTTPPTITAHPPNTPLSELPSGLVIEKEHTRLVMRCE
jgi:protein-L-isoaspartate(D-aspartate) O-methyltransferase